MTALDAGTPGQDGDVAAAGPIGGSTLPAGAEMCRQYADALMEDDDGPELREALMSSIADAHGKAGAVVASARHVMPFIPGRDTVEIRAVARRTTERYLRTLDPTATHYDFRAFDDREDREGGKLRPETFYNVTLATIDTWWPKLWRLNQRGYGIFVTVNATDGKGAKGANVTRVRSVIADCDGVDPSALVAAKAPHMAVSSSPGKWHLYWLAGDCPLEIFKPLHEALIAKYGTDTNVKDLPRVLRLPGFYHNKGKPCPVRFDYTLAPKANMELPPYMMAEINTGLGLDVGPAVAPATADGLASRGSSAALQPVAGAAAVSTLSPFDFGPQAVRDAMSKLPPPPETPENIAIMQAMLAVLDPDCERERWRDIVWAVLATLWDRAGELASEWSMKGAKWNEDAFAGVVNSFQPDRPGGKGFGSLIRFAEASGYKGPRPGQGGVLPTAEVAQEGAALIAGDGERPIVMVEPGEIAATASKAEGALRTAGVPIYQRGGKLVLPVLSRSKTTDGRTTLTASFKEASVPMLVDWLNRCANFQRFNAKAKKVVSIDPSKDVAETILSRRGEWEFPPVSGCVTSPVLRSDGTLLEAAGYDAATELYHFPDPGLTMPAMPEKPTRADAEAALALLESLLAGFPLNGPIDRAAALSAMLTAVLRGGMSIAPMHVIRAHTAGTGKSFLVDIATTLAAGHAAPAMAVGSNPEELEKRLVAAVLDGSPFVNLDNVNGTIGGDLLCQITERLTVKVRKLGKSESPSIDCKAAVFCNGNNTTVKGDLVRRTITCNLDAEMESPETRRFAFDPLARVQADRGRYLAAVIAIARGYMEAGCPDVCPPLGSYTEWTRMVRAPLMWLGMSDPVASQEAARAEDPVRASTRELMALWEASPKLASGTFYKAKDIADAAVFDLNLGEFLFRHCGIGSTVSTKSLGNYLSGIHGQVLDGRRIVMRTDPKHGNRYALERRGEAASGGV